LQGREQKEREILLNFKIERVFIKEDAKKHQEKKGFGRRKCSEKTSLLTLSRAGKRNLSKQ